MNAYITHRLNEVPEIADNVVVFRDGHLVAQGPIAEFDRERIVEAMTGEALGEKWEKLVHSPTSVEIIVGDPFSLIEDQKEETSVLLMSLLAN